MNGMAGNHQTNLNRRKKVTISETHFPFKNQYKLLWCTFVMLGPRILTWADTFEDLCPCRGSMTRMQPMQFRIPNQSSMPSYACLGGRLNSVVFCRQSNRPIERQQSTQRKRCDRWTPVFFGLGRSANNAITTTKKSTVSIVLCVRNMYLSCYEICSERWCCGCP